jgi:sugar phosphate permease
LDDSGINIAYWSMYTYAGNILSCIITGTVLYVEKSWTLALQSCTVLCIVVALLNIFHLSERFTIPSDSEIIEEENTSPSSHLLELENNNSLRRPRTAEAEQMHFWRALSLPHVCAYTVCVTCNKFVSGFLYFWLAYFVGDNLGVSAASACFLVASFELGSLASSPVRESVTELLGPNHKATFICVANLMSTLLLVFLMHFTSQTWSFYTATWLVLLFFCLGITVSSPAPTLLPAIAHSISGFPSVFKNANNLAFVVGTVNQTSSTLSTILLGSVGFLVSSYGWNVTLILCAACSFVGAAALLRMVKSELYDEGDESHTSDGGNLIPLPSDSSRHYSDRNASRGQFDCKQKSRHYGSI